MKPHTTHVSPERPLVVALKGLLGFANTQQEQPAASKPGADPEFSFLIVRWEIQSQHYSYITLSYIKIISPRTMWFRVLPQDPVVLLPRTLSVLFLGKGGPPPASPNWQPQRNPSLTACFLS